MENIDWSNEFEESLIMCSSNGVPYNNSKIGTSSSSSSQQMQKSELWNSRTGAGSGWGVAVNAGASRTFIEYSRPSALNSIDPLQNTLPILDPGISTLDHRQLKKPAMAAANTTASFESSLDCLLSASTSLTDTTATSADQDDGISLIFSDCKNLWNFASTGKILDTSSGEIITNQANSNKRKRGADSVSENLDSLSNYSADHQRSCSFQLISETHKKGQQRPVSSSSNINFQQSSSSASSAEEPDAEAIAQMKEIIYRAAAFRPVNLGEEAAEKPKRKNVRISKDPQTVAARQRRERISERIRVLQKLVPGGSKMDTASMLDEAANYLKFLRSQVKALEAFGHKSIDPTVNIFQPNTTNLAFSPFLGYSFAMQQPQFSIHNPSPVNQSKS